MENLPHFWFTRENRDYNLYFLRNPDIVLVAKKYDVSTTQSCSLLKILDVPKPVLRNM